MGIYSADGAGLGSEMLGVVGEVGDDGETGGREGVALRSPIRLWVVSGAAWVG